MATDTETFLVDIPGLGLDELTNASVRILEVKAKHGEMSATMEAVGRLEQHGTSPFAATSPHRDVAVCYSSR